MSEDRRMTWDELAAEKSRLKAKIAELELIISGKTFSLPTVAEMNACKAKGVREYGEHLCYVRDGFEAMTPEQFADKLEKGE